MMALLAGSIRLDMGERSVMYSLPFFVTGSKPFNFVYVKMGKSKLSALYKVFVLWVLCCLDSWLKVFHYFYKVILKV
ncbi:hypothetical protein HHK36_000153 [Tetracentron sinense]|uniref:Uncharacterized protein n=1 Tax=Tetracentron sinense TaxID=13715 RepID=A0A834ZVT4_TETSI|nr:hypothetical protein HHK36_000153 [Tetracentron sinense]